LIPPEQQQLPLSWINILPSDVGSRGFGGLRRGGERQLSPNQQVITSPHLTAQHNPAIQRSNAYR